MARAHGATMSSSSASGNRLSMKKSICMPTTASAWLAPRLPDIWTSIIDCAPIPALTGARQTRPTSIRRPSWRRPEFSAAGCWMRLRSGYRPPCVTPNTRRHRTNETRRNATYQPRETVQTTGASAVAIPTPLLRARYDLVGDDGLVRVDRDMLHDDLLMSPAAMAIGSLGQGV